MRHATRVRGDPAPVARDDRATELTFVVNGDIFPGEPVSITWKIKNFCSDLVRVIAKVSFLGNPLYTSSLLPIGLQDEIGEDNQPVVPTSAVINNFYKIGSKPLQLEVLAIGNDPGPYKVNASLVVKPEPVSVRCGRSRRRWWVRPELLLGSARTR